MQVHVLSSSSNVDQIAIGLSESTAVDNVQFQDHAATSVLKLTSTFRPLSKHESFAAAVSGDLSQVVKSAIIESICEKRQPTEVEPMLPYMECDSMAIIFQTYVSTSVACC